MNVQRRRPVDSAGRKGVGFIFYNWAQELITYPRGRSLLRFRHWRPWFARLEGGVPGLASRSPIFQPPFFDLRQELYRRLLPPLILSRHFKELRPDSV